MLQKLLKSYYRSKGYDTAFRKYKLVHSEFPHSIVIPRATYSPWKDDKRFQEIFNAVKNHTLLDIYKGYELWQLVNEVKHLEGDYIEIGAWRGGSSGIIGTQISRVDERSILYVCDTFTGVVKASNNDNKYNGGEHSDTSEEIVESLLSKDLQLSNYEILTGIFPDETGSKIQNKKFKYCHIDVDVHDGAKVITEWLWEKVPVGGVLIYDDYGFSGTSGVTKFIESVRGLNDRVVIHNLNGHAVVIKTA